MVLSREFAYVRAKWVSYEDYSFPFCRSCFSDHVTTFVHKRFFPNSIRSSVEQSATLKLLRYSSAVNNSG